MRFSSERGAALLDVALLAACACATMSLVSPGTVQAVSCVFQKADASRIIDQTFAQALPVGYNHIECGQRVVSLNNTSGGS